MELMAKADRILKLWTNRNLSLLAKIQVVNSLVYSLFAYRMDVLDKLEDKFIRMFNVMIEKFIWNNRRPKISLQILMANKQQGGTALVNFKLKDKVSKLAWVPRVIKSQKMKTLAYELLNNSLGDLLWETELEVKDVDMFFKDKGF